MEFRPGITQTPAIAEEARIKAKHITRQRNSGLMCQPKNWRPQIQNRPPRLLMSSSGAMSEPAPLG
jgi:hypothetical protein